MKTEYKVKMAEDDLKLAEFLENYSQQDIHLHRQKADMIEWAKRLRARNILLMEEVISGESSI